MYKIQYDLALEGFHQDATKILALGLSDRYITSVPLHRTEDIPSTTRLLKILMLSLRSSQPISPESAAFKSAKMVMLVVREHAS